MWRGPFAYGHATAVRTEDGMTVSLSTPGWEAVRVRVQRLGAGASAAAVLRGLHERALRLGLPPPAAPTGEWFGSAAVLVPSVALRPRAMNVAFAAEVPGKPH